MGIEATMKGIVILFLVGVSGLIYLTHTDRNEANNG
jgi:hypothetical protein